MDRIDDKRIRDKVKRKYKGRCAYCGCKLNKSFTIDHIEPKLRNMYYSNREPGADVIDNYNPCCYPCNSSKGAMSLEKWRQNIKHKIIQLNRDSSTYRTAKRFGLVKETGNEVVFYFEKNG